MSIAPKVASMPSFRAEKQIHLHVNSYSGLNFGSFAGTYVMGISCHWILIYSVGTLIYIYIALDVVAEWSKVLKSVPWCDTH